jgi:hypothetical protein
MKAPKIKCPHCNGVGTVELTGVYADTLALLKKNPGSNGAGLARIAGCKETAMNNRLVALRQHGLARAIAYGRQKKWYYNV